MDGTVSRDRTGPGFATSMPMNPHDPDDPQQSVQFLKGVGPEKAELFAKMGVHTVEDLLYLIPREYEDFRESMPISGLVDGAKCVVRGRLEYVEARETRAGRSIVEAAYADGTGFLSVAWFNRPTVAERFRLEREYLLTGKVKRVDGRWRMTNPAVEPVPDDGCPSLGEAIVPVYPLTDGMHPEAVRRAVRVALDRFTPTIADPLPPEYRRQRGLVGLPDALRAVHFPVEAHDRDRARARLVYDEFLTLQVALAIRRAGRRRRRGIRIHTTAEIDRRILRLFPFEFTASQKEVVEDLRADLAGSTPMYRLVQGDVGVGKTAVALYAMLSTIANGYQAALLAPTEVLARQHYAGAGEWLSASRVRLLLLTGSLDAASRAEARRRLAQGEADLIVGTHALMQKDVAFAKLGLVVIDEQHKFGVRQRAAFQDLDPMPHHLIMTATPIPRSLAMTWFGDLEISEIVGRPLGREAPLAYVVASAERHRAYRFLEQRVRAGALGLVVCPRIDDDPEDSLQSVRRIEAELSAGGGNGLEVGVLHGRMSDVEKDRTLRQFRSGAIRLLISTVVVEVGIDVPDAQVVIIENAERFGLSQLHQIRGRVGRSETRGICFLIDGSEDDAIRRRLEELARTSDGFEVAELDARVRGVGETIGLRQHGFVRPRIGDFVRDRPLLERTRADARAIVAGDPSLSSPEWSTLRNQVLRRYGKTMSLALVG